MNSFPHIAVLLAAYQGRQWIEEQVESIFLQKGVEVTLFVSVDLSNDGTYEWFKSLSENRANVHVLPYGERFGGAGANFFRLLKDVDISEFDAVSLADQDDIWLDDKLERAYSFISAQKCDVYSSDVLAFWQKGEKRLIKKSYPQLPYDYLFEAAGPGCTYVFSRDAALQFQAFLLSLGEKLDRVVLHDWLAYAYCRHQGMTWYIDDTPSMLYRQHKRNQVGANKGLSAYRKRLKMVAKRYYRDQVELVTSLLNPTMSELLGRYRYRLLNVTRFRRRPRDRFALLILFLFCIY